MEHVNTLEFSDLLLKHLYEILLSTKVTATSQELLLLKLGKSQSPVLDLTLYVAEKWETRAGQLQQEAKSNSSAE